ncbi:MAG TPA: PTS sugar transporter subunit IIA, partial [Brachybacterium faecium]|nr:PTS sugar transporter subunit IIA [Brachybacterium faecium]
MSAPLITSELVRLDVDPPGDKHAVIGLMADLIAATGRAERDGLEAGLLKREESFATGMPGGFAIPHCRTEAVDEAALGLLRLAEPVDFGSADGPADLILGIAAPAGTDDQHLQLLAQLSRALIRPEFLADLRAASTPQQAADLVMGVLEPQTAQTEPAPAPGAAPAPEDAADPAQPENGSPVTPPSTAPATATPAADGDAGPGADSAPVLLAITSCPTGIAHTYMAAESLENAAQEKGVELHVETQGSGGITPFTDAQIAAASALIVAADVTIS